MSDLYPTALTWYERGRETTVWVNLPYIPAKGTVIDLGPNIPKSWVRSVTLVPEPWPGRDDEDEPMPLPGRWSLWHTEITLGAPL